MSLYPLSNTFHVTKNTRLSIPAQLQGWKLNTIILSRILTTSLHSKCHASTKGGVWSAWCAVTKHIRYSCIHLALSKLRLVRVYCKHMHSLNYLTGAGGSSGVSNGILLHLQHYTIVCGLQNTDCLLMGDVHHGVLVHLVGGERGGQCLDGNHLFC